MPNGRYLLRVVASDAPSNSPSTALTGAHGEHAFDIDNAPPAITITVGPPRRRAARCIAFDVRDEHSAVQKADYSLDGDRWQTIYPKDGIADSRFEQFELVLEGEAAARGVIVRADRCAEQRGERAGRGAAGGAGAQAVVERRERRSAAARPASRRSRRRRLRRVRDRARLRRRRRAVCGPAA